jgi:alpha-tubulin suppressor-like RCC1 family protein
MSSLIAGFGRLRAGRYAYNGAISSRAQIPEDWKGDDVRKAVLVAICLGFGWGCASSKAHKDSAEDLRNDGLGGAVEVTAGGQHACARFASGEVACWGANHFGQLGHGGEELMVSSPVLVDGLNDAIAIAAGTAHTCAVHKSGEVSCWGLVPVGNRKNSRGSWQSPINQRAAVFHSSPVKVARPGGVRQLPNRDKILYCAREGVLTGATDITATTFETCVRHTSGEILCWGDHDVVEVVGKRYGEEDVPRGCPVPVSGDRESNTFAEDPSDPTVVPGLGAVVAVDQAGERHCAASQEGEVLCWNSDDVEDGEFVRSPQGIEGIIGATAVGVGGVGFVKPAQGSPATGYTPAYYNSATEYPFACALARGGEVHCWGNNEYGQLGQGRTGAHGDAQAIGFSGARERGVESAANELAERGGRGGPGGRQARSGLVERRGRQCVQR